MVIQIIIIFNAIMFTASLFIYAHFRKKKSYFKNVALAWLIGIILTVYTYLCFFKDWTMHIPFFEKYF